MWFLSERIRFTFTYEQNVVERGIGVGVYVSDVFDPTLPSKYLSALKTILLLLKVHQLMADLFKRDDWNCDNQGRTRMTVLEKEGWTIRFKR